MAPNPTTTHPWPARLSARQATLLLLLLLPPLVGACTDLGVESTLRKNAVARCIPTSRLAKSCDQIVDEHHDVCADEAKFFDTSVLGLGYKPQLYNDCLARRAAKVMRLDDPRQESTFDKPNKELKTSTGDKKDEAIQDVWHKPEGSYDVPNVWKSKEKKKDDVESGDRTNSDPGPKLDIKHIPDDPPKEKEHEDPPKLKDPDNSVVPNVWHNREKVGGALVKPKS